ncbi:MAG TPA: hypothetical protein VL752_00460, partial [Acidisoma sp.]|nr:hypothetical protein [Acidisoma sp.]
MEFAPAAASDDEVPKNINRRRQPELSQSTVEKQVPIENEFGLHQVDEMEEVLLDDHVSDPVAEGIDNQRFRCRDCGRQFNKRSGGVLNRMSFPSDIINFVGFRRLRYRLTLRDLSEMLLLRGFIVSHEAVRDWATKLLPLLG